MWQAMMGPIIQAAANRSETQLTRLLGQDENWSTPWGKGPYWNQATIPETARATASQQVQGTVEGAQRSGVHPVYALGGGAAGGSVPSGGAVFQQPASQPGVGMPHIPAGVKEMTGAALRESQARAAKDEALADYWASQKTLAEQGANVGGGSQGVQVLPLGASAPPLSMRPLVSEPRQSIPEYIDVVDREGRHYEVLNPQWDELSQAHYGYEKARRVMSEVYEGLSGSPATRAASGVYYNSRR